MKLLSQTDACCDLISLVFFNQGARTWLRPAGTGSTVNDQLDVLGKIVGHFGNDVAFQKADQRMAMGRAQHEHVHSESGGKIEDGAGGIVAYDI